MGRRHTYNSRSTHIWNLLHNDCAKMTDMQSVICNVTLKANGKGQSNSSQREIR